MEILDLFSFSHGIRAGWLLPAAIVADASPLGSSPPFPPLLAAVAALSPAAVAALSVAVAAALSAARRPAGSSSPVIPAFSVCRRSSLRALPPSRRAAADPARRHPPPRIRRPAWSSAAHRGSLLSPPSAARCGPLLGCSLTCRRAVAASPPLLDFTSVAGGCLAVACWPPLRLLSRQVFFCSSIYCCDLSSW